MKHRCRSVITQYNYLVSVSVQAHVYTSSQVHEGMSKFHLCHSTVIKVYTSSEV